MRPVKAFGTGPFLLATVVVGLAHAALLHTTPAWLDPHAEGAHAPPPVHAVRIRTAAIPALALAIAPEARATGQTRAHPHPFAHAASGPPATAISHPRSPDADANVNANAASTDHTLAARSIAEEPSTHLDADAPGFVPADALAWRPMPFSAPDTSLLDGAGASGMPLRARIFVSSAGTVLDVVSLAPLLAQDEPWFQRLRAMFRHTQFTPGQLDGQAVASSLDIDISVE